MKFGTTIALCAVSAIGTAIALDKITDGLIRDTISDILIDRGLNMKNDIESEFDDFEDHIVKDEDMLDKDIIAFYRNDSNTPYVVTMPIQDATNIYQMLEDAIGRLSESASDIEAFGDKAISFERLYDALEEVGVIDTKVEDESTEPIIDDPSVCGHSEEKYDAEDTSKLDSDSGNYDITSKDSF